MNFITNKRPEEAYLRKNIEYLASLKMTFSTTNLLQVKILLAFFNATYGIILTNRQMLKPSLPLKTKCFKANKNNKSQKSDRIYLEASGQS